MVLTNSALLGPRAKVERAKEHIVQLEKILGIFLESDPYKVVAKRDSQTRKPIYYVGNIKHTPALITTISGDILQNLRSALDHLAYQLFLVGTNGASGPGRHIYFPIADSPPEYKSSLPGKVKGMRQDAIDAINCIEPYKGGKGHQLWVLHKLNNIDKHRLLVAVGSAYRSVNVGPMLHRNMQELLGGRSVVPKLDLFLKPADKLCPLKVGDELFVGAPDAEIDQQMQFRFNVAFGEPQIIEGEPLLETLKQMANIVDGLIPSFGPCLK